MDAAIRVLLVDDSPDFADLVSDFLERNGFEVVTATSASDGLSMMEDGVVDCVVSDFEMPDRDGLEFLEAVRENHGDLPFILFTGKGSEEIASEAISAGVTDYLQKGHGKEQYDLLSKRITNAVNQYRAEERAAHLERVNSVVREVDKALVRASAREDIERRVGEIISRSDPYRFAWIAEHDPISRIVTPRASAGIEAGYLDEISVTADDSPEGRGPIGRAIRTREIAVSQNVQEDPQFEPWRQAALERGFQAVAGVPLIYDESLFGVLTVYADRPYAFDEDEQTLLAELGADIAHAIHALETTNRLRRNRDRIRAVMEAIPDFAIVFNEAGRFEEVLAGPDEEFDTDPEDLIGRTLTEVIPAEPASAIQRAISRTLATGEIQQVEYRLVIDESVHWFDARLTPLVSDLTRSQSVVFLARDITERKERERQLDTLITNLPGIVYRCANEPEWPMELVRGECAELTGYPADALVSDDVVWGEDVIHPDHQHRMWDEVQAALDEGHPFEVTYRIQTAEDEQKWAWERGRGVYGPDGDVEALEGFITDITDRRAYEERLEALNDVATELDACTSTEDVHKRLVEAAVDSLDLDVCIIYEPDDDRLMPKYSFPEIPLAERPVLGIDEGIAGETYQSGTSFRIDDLEAHAVAKPHNDWKSGLSVAIGTAAVMQAGSADRDAFDSDDLQLLELLAHHGATALERIERTDELRAERRRLSRQNDRLEEFASVLTHDLRGPLGVASGNLELAREAFDSDRLERTAANLERMDRIIEDTLTLAREGKAITDPRTVSLEDLCNRCWSNIKSEDTTLTIEEDTVFEADPDRLARLLENLFRNAVLHAGDDVAVTVGPLDVGFYVEDDGSGIPRADRDEVLDPEYSTDDEGIGLGLAIVNRIAEAHGWTLTVTESATGGARFEFTGSDAAD